MYRLIRNSISSVFRLPICFIKPTVQSRVSTRFTSTVKDAPVEVKPSKIIYTYDQPVFFRRLNILGLTWFFVYVNFVTYFVPRVKEEVKDDEELAFPLFKNFKVNMKKFQLGMLGLFTVLFTGAALAVIIYTTRAVRHIVLRKNDLVTIVTYTPFGRENAQTVPLKWVSGYRYRSKDETYLPLKIKHRWFYYLIDMRGEFREPEIFDRVINLSRTIK